MNKMVISFIVFFFMTISYGVAQEKQEDWMFNLPVKLDRNLFNDFWKQSSKIIGGDKIDSAIYFTKSDSLLRAYSGDSIRLTDFVKMFRGALDLFTQEDPHFRIYPQFIRNGNNVDASKRNYGKYIMALPCNFLQINDSLIVAESLDEKLLKGDLILKINGRSSKELLDYTYRDRYINSVTMQLQNHMMFTRNYDFQLVRNGKVMDITVTGVSLNDYNSQLTNRNSSNQKVLDGNIGYFEIQKFVENKRIIKELGKFIKKIKDAGGRSIIIDIRKNTGGTGKDFDKLISIFTPKEEIGYLRDAKVVLAEKSQGKDSIRRIVSLPDSKIIKRISLTPKRYMGKMDYYILMSINTGSMASSFANIMQYNDFGLLVGEPMRRNATKYGDVYEQNTEVKLVFSTVEYDELTKAIDGIIYPDISIPYVAEEYMKGGDPLLDKLIKVIKSKENGASALE